MIFIVAYSGHEYQLFWRQMGIQMNYNGDIVYRGKFQWMIS